MTTGVGKHYIGPVGRLTWSLSTSLKKKSSLVGRLGSGVRINASFQKNTRLVGRLGTDVDVEKKQAQVIASLPDSITHYYAYSNENFTVISLRLPVP